MLLLLLDAGDDRYAINTRHIVEVVPRVALNKIHQAPDYVAGMFNYRGAIVPVIDICHLIQGHPCRSHLSTRIILINYPGSDRTPRLLGLLAERVTETLNKSDTDFIDPEITVNNAPYLGKIMTDERGMIQCLQVEYLLPESQQASLLSKPER